MRRSWPSQVKRAVVIAADADDQLVDADTWGVMNRTLAELPAGSGTTYGDVAALIGSSPVAVGTRLARTPAPNAHRVLRSDGTVPPDFHWLDAACQDAPEDLSRSEGVEFDDTHASPAQRVKTADLARLIGREADDLPSSGS